MNAFRCNDCDYDQDVDDYCECCGSSALVAMSLNEILNRSGFETRKAGGLYRKEVIDCRSGKVVFTGTAGEVLEWMRGGAV